MSRFFPTFAYSQETTTLIVGGIPIVGFMDGSSITVTYDGGEVSKTEGTDGPAVNMATRQGGTITFTLQEVSPSHTALDAARNLMRFTRVGVPVVLSTGAGLVYTLTGAVLSNPGQLATGGKTQGGIQYTITGTDITRVTLPVPNPAAL